MKLSITSTLALTLALFIVATGGADVVQFQFAGTVTSAFDNDPNNGQNNVYGEDVSTGQQVNGTFSFDTSLASSDSQPGVEFYSPTAPAFFSVQIGATTYTNDGIFFMAVADDFGSPANDIVVIGDGDDSDPSTNVGDTILINGVSKVGFISWRIFDSSFDAFSGTTLPSEINIQDFDFTEGEISGTDTNGIFGLARYSIDTVNLVAIPEPTSSAWIAFSMFSVATLRRRR